jgi:hypothetical protein
VGLLVDGNVKCWDADVTPAPATMEWLGASIDFTTQSDGGVTSVTNIAARLSLSRQTLTDTQKLDPRCGEYHDARRSSPLECQRQYRQ